MHNLENDLGQTSNNEKNDIRNIVCNQETAKDGGSYKKATNYKDTHKKIFTTMSTVKTKHQTRDFPKDIIVIIGNSTICEVHEKEPNMVVLLKCREFLEQHQMT